MSARAAAIEAAGVLARAVSGAPWSREVQRAVSILPPAQGRADPYLLKVLRFLAERVLPIRESEEPWAAPQFRLFAEAFMLSGEFQEALRQGLAQVRSRAGSAALDLHSGPGVCLEAVAGQWGKLIAVDPSSLNLELVEERLAAAGARSYELIVGDCTNLSGRVRDPVGLAISASPVNWFYDARAVVGRLYSLLEPGGYLLLVAPLERGGSVSPLNPFIAAVGGRRPPSREELEDMLLSEGFARVRVREGELLSAVVAVKP